MTADAPELVRLEPRLADERVELVVQADDAPHAKRVLADDGHWYGYNAEAAFIRQRHDWPPETAELLGPAIGLHLADLEYVIDTVRDGGRIAPVRGRPLSAEERARARHTLQAFVDDVTPVVEEVVSGDRSPDAALAAIQPLRRRLNRDLVDALGLTGDQFRTLFPHIPASEI